ncbi:MAG: tetratricopeptide repeat protein [Candidatus Rokubacteria bacterium]|nr:tetratricopeptide repeat protein [Candidatus Rokubacteria bacterium]
MIGIDWLSSPRGRRQLAIALGAVVLVALAGAGIWAWSSAYEARGRQALADAAQALQQSQAPNAPPEARERAIKALEAVLAEYPRLSALPEVAYRLGNLRYASGQFAEARGAYEVALAKGATGAVKALSAVSIGYTWEALKDYARAEDAYRKAASSLGARDFLLEDLLLDEARVQEAAGKHDAAVETYRRLLKAMPDSRRAEEIRMRLAAIQAAPRAK